MKTSPLPVDFTNLAHTPMARYGRQEDVGWVAVYLCSRAAGFITGTSLAIGGGGSVGC